jgi:aminocarboxymuconate-semialdehyde decarboxylase
MPTTNRRQFLSAVAVAAGAAIGADRVVGAAPGRLARQPAPARRQITIDGRRVRVVDVHAHCVVPAVDAVIAGTPLARNAGAPVGTLALGPERIRQMDQQGLDMQALSINGFWWYAADRDLAARIVRAQNEGLARWVAAHPDRFVAMASVALQHPDLAAEQLEDAATRLGLRGVSIGGHVNGEDLSLPKYDPFWQKAALILQIVVE